MIFSVAFDLFQNIAKLFFNEFILRLYFVAITIPQKLKTIMINSLCTKNITEQAVGSIKS